jgi:hypothetical protein
MNSRMRAKAKIYGSNNRQTPMRGTGVRRLLKTLYEQFIGRNNVSKIIEWKRCHLF